MNQICGQTFKALASNLSKFGFVRQKSKEQSLLQRYYLCPHGFERGGSNVDLKKVTSKTKLGSSLSYTFDAQVPGAINPSLLAHPLIYKIQASPQAIPAVESTGYKEFNLSNSGLLPVGVTSPQQISHVPIMSYNHVLPNNTSNGKNLNINNLPSLHDEQSWPKLLSLDIKPIRVFTGPFDKRDENFRINVHALLTKKATPACPEVPFSPLIQENCGDLYLTRLRGVPPDGLDWPTTPHTRVIYRTQTGRLQVGGSNQALQDGNVAVMRRHVWKSLCNRFKRHEYVLIDGQQKNKYWNVKEESPVLYCYFRVVDEENNHVLLSNHLSVMEKQDRPIHVSEQESLQYRNEALPPMMNNYRSPLNVPSSVSYEMKMTDLDSIVEASVKMSSNPAPSTPPTRRSDISHIPTNGVAHSALPMSTNGYSHPPTPSLIMPPVLPSNSFVQSPPPPPVKTYTLPFPGSKDPLPINTQMPNGQSMNAVLGPNEVSNLLAMIENLKQQLKATEVIKESQRVSYEKQVFDLTIENQNLKKQLDLFISKFNSSRDSFNNAPMVDGLVPPRGFNPAILAALQQTANMAHTSGLGAPNSPIQARANHYIN